MASPHCNQNKKQPPADLGGISLKDCALPGDLQLTSVLNSGGFHPAECQCHPPSLVQGQRLSTLTTRLMDLFGGSSPRAELRVLPIFFFRTSTSSSPVSEWPLDFWGQDLSWVSRYFSNTDKL